MEQHDEELIKYKNIKEFLYNTDIRDGGMFILPSKLGLMFNMLIGTISLLIDIVVAEYKIIPIVFLILNVFMTIMPYFYYKKYSKDDSFTYSYFLPAIFKGLSGVYSSIVFLYLIHELLYSAMGHNVFVKSYMTLVVFVYFIIILVQYIWYFIALKKVFTLMTTMQVQQ